MYEQAVDKVAEHAVGSRELVQKVSERVDRQQATALTVGSPIKTRRLSCD